MDWSSSPGLHGLLVLCFLSTVLAQTAYYPLNYADASMLNGANRNCLEAYNEKVACPQAIGSLYVDAFPSFQQNVLDALCTNSCFQSLVDHRSRVSSECGPHVTYNSVSDSSTRPVTYFADKAIYNYNMTCLARSDGQFCNRWFQTGANTTASPECDECYMEIVLMQAESSFGPVPEEMRSIYSSLSTSCSYTGLPATKTALPVPISSPTGALVCNARYAIQPGDTYLSISLAQKVATHDLITANGLSYSLQNFPTSGTLCIRNQCTVYAIKAGDTCSSIGQANKLSRAEILSWNPFINGLCDNISQKVGQTLCVSNPLGNYLAVNNTGSSIITTPAPVPGNIAPETVTRCGLYYELQGGEDCGTLGLKYNIELKDFRFLNPHVWENCTNLWLEASYCVIPVGDIASYPGYAAPTSTFEIIPESSTPIPWFDPFEESGNAVVIPIAEGTRTDCWDYIWWNSSLGSPLSCWDIAVSAEIDAEEFILWNPSLDQNAEGAPTPTYDYPCTISPSLSYCWAVASPTPEAVPTMIPPSPRAAGEIEGCTEWFVGVLNCESHLSLLRISLSTFYEYNPSVGSDCSSYVLGTYYCYSTSIDGSVPDTDDPTSTTTSPTATSSGHSGITTPTPIQNGMTSNCKDFHKVVLDEGCEAISSIYGISVANFYSWNPAVGNQCRNLWPDYYVCVGIKTTPGPTGSTSGVTAPSSTPTLIVSDNGLCGGTSGKTCTGSQFGNCCSSSGYCGSSADYCNVGCQKAFGSCNSGSENISPDGTCGGVTMYNCRGSAFGSCCSSSGYCGATSDYCGNGCQSAFGNCG